MALRTRLVGALRYFKTHPNVSEKELKYIASKLEEEGEPEDIEKRLRSAYGYLKKSQSFKPGHPIMRNITRLSRQVRRAAES